MNRPANNPDLFFGRLENFCNFDPSALVDEVVGLLGTANTPEEYAYMAGVESVAFNLSGYLADTVKPHAVTTDVLHAFAKGRQYGRRSLTSVK